MNRETATKLLEELLKWRLDPWTPVATVSAARYDREPTSGTRTPRLPFGLEHTLESVDTDQAAGITDYASVDKWLRYWNPWISAWAGLPNVYREQPGGIILNALQTSPVFDHIDQWDENDLEAWDEFTRELQTAHKKVANATGHQPRDRGLCPYCLTGTLQQHPDKHGYPNQATCINCHAVINYDSDETHTTITRLLQNYDGNDIYLTPRQIKTIWPHLPHGTLRRWVHEGHVTKQAGKYRLADINKHTSERHAKQTAT